MWGGSVVETLTLPTSPPPTSPPSRRSHGLPNVQQRMDDLDWREFAAFADADALGAADVVAVADQFLAADVLVVAGADELLAGAVLVVGGHHDHPLAGDAHAAAFVPPHLPHLAHLRHEHLLAHRLVDRLAVHVIDDG